ncbi:MAG: NUDIX hydrolase [Pseudomonadota bacterium]
MDKSAIRDAATVIVLRDAATRPAVLMGQRGATAAFMPNKFVFPGGAVDAGDADVPFAAALNMTCADRLLDQSTTPVPALAGAAIRELWEETGLVLGAPGDWPDALPDWQNFAAQGMRPDASALKFVFRAITPPGRPRRFDARFFLADAAALQGDPDDFTHACDELSHLQWVQLDQARSFDLPFITEVVLAEITGLLPALDAPASVPFFKNNDEESLFLRLKATGSARG